jgi:iron complex outermembrane receptor protein
MMRTQLTLALMALSGALTAPGILRAQTAPAAAADSDVLGDIVVTAQRRSERLQDVPLAVSAFDASALTQTNVTGITDLKTVVPAFSGDTEFGTVLPFLRGVGNPGVVVGNESSVPIYVDGVYISRLNSSFFEFSDIDRVEVLKGPQGTLFGRNSTGGLVQIITRDPTNDPTIEGSIGYGNYQTTDAKLYASGGQGPIAGNVALYFHDQSEGWGRNITTGNETYKEHDLGAHTKWIFHASDSSTFTLAGDFTSTTSSIGLVQDEYAGSVQGNPITGVPFPSLPFYDSRDAYPTNSIVHAGGTSLRYDQDLSFGHLRDITAYRETRGTLLIDADFSPYLLYDADEPYQVSQLSQELQLSSLDSSSIRWLVGFFYLHLNSAYVPTELTGTDFVPVGLAVDLYGREIDNSYAGYGQTTFPIADQTSLTLGARYTADSVVGTGQTNVSEVNGPTVVSGTPLEASTHFDKATWRVGLDHHFSTDILGYVSDSRGFKAGIYNLQPFSGQVVKPEVMDAGEIGLKTEWFDRRLRLNGALFYNHITDPQVEKDLPSGVSLINADSAVTKGLDVDGDAEPIRNLTVRYGFTWMSALYKSFANAPFYYSNPSPPYGNLPNVISGNADGARMPRAPDFVFSVALDYRIPLPSGELEVGPNYWHTSTFYWTPDEVFPQRAYGLLGAQLTYKPVDRHWDVRLAGRNLTGAKYYTGMEELTGPAGTVGAPGAPRTVTLTFDFRN